MYKIGVIGLGGIAQKAYLPVMAGLQNDFEWHLTTRNINKGAALAARYGFTHFHQTLDQLLAAQPDAVFVHTPTATHADIVRRLLEAGVNVYVDKPVAEDPQQVRALYTLAEQKDLLLTCGFNRRFAPVNERLKMVTGKQLIVAEKTRVHTLQDAPYATWDLLIHPLDTALWLLDEPVAHQTARVVSNPAGQLLQAYTTISGTTSEVQVVVNMDAAANLEEVTVQGARERVVTRDLQRVVVTTAAGTLHGGRPDWEPTLETRGFAPLIRAFLAAVTGEASNPVSPESVIRTHELCARVVAEIGGRS